MIRIMDTVSCMTMFQNSPKFCSDLGWINPTVEMQE